MNNTSIEELVTEFLPIVRSIARRIHRRYPDPTVDLDDLVSLGTIGLIHAQEQYKEDAGASFHTYAKKRILWAIYDGLKRWSSHLTHLPGRKKPGQECGFDDLFEGFEPASTNPDPCTEYEHTILKEDLSCLDNRERRVIHFRFWMGYSLDECSQLEGISRERIRQLQLRAIEKLRAEQRFKNRARYARLCKR